MPNRRRAFSGERVHLRRCARGPRQRRGRVEQERGLVPAPVRARRLVRRVGLEEEPVAAVRRGRPRRACRAPLVGDRAGEREVEPERRVAPRTCSALPEKLWSTPPAGSGLLARGARAAGRAPEAVEHDRQPVLAREGEVAAEHRAAAGHAGAPAATLGAVEAALADADRAAARRAPRRGRRGAGRRRAGRAPGGAAGGRRGRSGRRAYAAAHADERRPAVGPDGGDDEIGHARRPGRARRTASRSGVEVVPVEVAVGVDHAAPSPCTSPSPSPALHPGSGCTARDHLHEEQAGSSRCVTS